MNARPRDKSCKLFHELQWLKNNLGGAIVIGSFELIDDLTPGINREPLFADGGSCNISGDLLKLISLPRAYGNACVESEPGILANKAPFAEVVPVEVFFSTRARAKPEICFLISR
jgi:hypothetical protein